jgi:hypothetical protein
MNGNGSNDSNDMGSKLESISFRLQRITDDCEWLEHRLQQAAVASSSNINVNAVEIANASAGLVLKDVERMYHGFQLLVEVVALQGRWERGRLFSFFSDMTADFADSSLPVLLEEQEDIFATVDSVLVRLNSARQRLEDMVISCALAGHPCGMDHNDQQSEEVCRRRLHPHELTEMLKQISQLGRTLGELNSTLKGHLFHVASVTAPLWEHLSDTQRELIQDYPKQY